jgi:hypothetical protein
MPLGAARRGHQVAWEVLVGVLDGAAAIGDDARHPLLSPHAAGRRSAVRLSETVEPRRLSRGEVYCDLLRPLGFVYGIAIGIPTGRGQVLVAGLGRGERVTVLAGKSGRTVEARRDPDARSVRWMCG